MTVVEGWFSGRHYDALPTPDELPAAAAREISLNCALNSKVGCMSVGNAAGSVALGEDSSSK